MANLTLSKPVERMPSFFDDILKPWNEFFEDGPITGRVMNIPAANIIEQDNAFMVSLAAPGLKKEDFKIEIVGNMLSISSEKEEKTENKDKKFTRKEYNYSSFCRSFTLPEEIQREKIEAHYENGVLTISLPRKEEIKKQDAKKIPVN